MERILLIEDHPSMQQLVTSVFSSDFRISVASTIAEGVKLIKEIAFDLVLLDLHLPDGDGLKFLASVKNDSHYQHVPILLMTGSNDIADKLMGFSLGAEDYIVKPFEPMELKARVMTRLRHAQKARQKEETLKKGNLLLHVSMQKAVISTDSEHELRLTPLEFKLLYHFARHEDHVLTREQLIDSVWGSGVHIIDRTIDTHVSNLRKKIAAADYEIRAVHGVGYTFKRKATDTFAKAA